MTRVYNFSAGPAALPQDVLEQLRDEMLDWHGHGMSVMEMSHRGKAFVGIAQQAEADLRELLAVPSNYRVLFLQGGATAQFAAIPLNLTTADSVVDLVNTGAWSKKAVAEAKKYCKVNVVADAAASKYAHVPPEAEWKRSADAAYLHYTPNETIGGVEFPFIPGGDVPLVADFSSTLLSRPLDVSRFGVVYAGAQKNIGPSGVTVVIIRDDLLDRVPPNQHALLDYRNIAANGSLANTPNTWGIYLIGLVCEWLKQQGGVAEIQKRNEEKAEILYKYIDSSDGFYAGHAEKKSRSMMNVTFRLPSPELDDKFSTEAEALGLDGLRGHRSVGGIRASIYNAFPREGVEALVSFMDDFVSRNG